MTIILTGRKIKVTLPIFKTNILVFQISYLWLSHFSLKNKTMFFTWWNYKFKRKSNKCMFWFANFQICKYANFSCRSRMRVSLKICVIEQSLIINCHYESFCYKDSYNAETSSLINCFSTLFEYWQQGFGNIQYCIFLLAWNPDVCPKYTMVDYDNAEIANLEEVFPDIQVFLSDFHRERSWHR